MGLTRHEQHDSATDVVIEHSVANRQPRRNSQDLWIGVSRDLLITTL